MLMLMKMLPLSILILIFLWTNNNSNTSNNNNDKTKDGVFASYTNIIILDVVRCLVDYGWLRVKSARIW